MSLLYYVFDSAHGRIKPLITGALADNSGGSRHRRDFRGTEVRTPTFMKWEDGHPHFISTPSQKLCLAPSLSRSLSYTGVGFFYRRLFVYFSARYRKKPMQLGQPNLTNKCSTVNLGNRFILESEGQRSTSRITNHRNCRHGSLHSCECWLLLTLSRCA